MTSVPCLHQDQVSLPARHQGAALLGMGGVPFGDLIEHQHLSTDQRQVLHAGYSASLEPSEGMGALRYAAFGGHGSVEPFARQLLHVAPVGEDGLHIAAKVWECFGDLLKAGNVLGADIEQFIDRTVRSPNRKPACDHAARLVDELAGFDWGHGEHHD